MSHQFTASEKTTCASLTLLYVIRMLGLFIVLPLFSLYEKELEGSTPFLIGLAFSSYAITQMLLQPLFGYASDRYGRKPVIIIGLALFIIGSLIIASTHHIYWVLLGRVIQGSGAISAAILALATDLTRDAIRTRVMAMIGISIGITFGLAMFLGPYLQSLIGMQGIFLVCAGLGILGIFITVFVLPNPPTLAATSKRLQPQPPHKIQDNPMLGNVILEPNLWRLYVGAMGLHLLLTMAFMVIPWGLKNINLEVADHWKIYVPCFFISIFVMGALVGIGEKRGQLKPLFLSAIGFLMIAFMLLIIANSLWAMSLALTCFFIGFNVMEATQPSLMARFAPEDTRGMAMGIFSSMQFLGASIGGILGASIYGYIGFSTVYLVGILISFLWLLLALGMKNPPLRAH